MIIKERAMAAWRELLRLVNNNAIDDGDPVGDLTVSMRWDRDRSRYVVGVDAGEATSSGEGPSLALAVAAAAMADECEGVTLTAYGAWVCRECEGAGCADGCIVDDRDRTPISPITLDKVKRLRPSIEIAEEVAKEWSAISYGTARLAVSDDRKGWRLELVTGGWSECEDYLASLSDPANLERFAWRALTWRSSHRGGLHVFGDGPLCDEVEQIGGRHGS